MQFFASQKFLAIYSGVLTLVFAATVLSGFANSSDHVQLRELDVQRINVVEPDGTLRMVISDKADFPGAIFKGKELPHPDRKTAGMLFFNDEGTENGGLVFGGYMGKDGKPVSYGHLSFDKYMQDQTMQLEADQEGGTYYKHLTINDQPDYPLTDFMPLAEKFERDPSAANKAAVERFFAEHGGPVPRLFLGEHPEQGLTLNMKDNKGRNRIVMRVQPDGSPVLQFLDEDGKVISQLPQSATKN